MHEHPIGAKSWGLRSIKRLLGLSGVRRYSGDQCQFGAKVRKGKLKGSPIRKPSGFMTNAQWLGAELNRKCIGTDPRRCTKNRKALHAPCNGRVAKQVAIVPKGLCKAIIRGTEKQLKVDLQRAVIARVAVEKAPGSWGPGPSGKTTLGAPAQGDLIHVRSSFAGGANQFKKLR